MKKSEFVEQGLLCVMFLAILGVGVVGADADTVQLVREKAFDFVEAAALLLLAAIIGLSCAVLFAVAVSRIWPDHASMERRRRIAELEKIAAAEAQSDHYLNSETYK